MGGGVSGHPGALGRSGRLGTEPGRKKNPSPQWHVAIEYGDNNTCAIHSSHVLLKLPPNIRELCYDVSVNLDVLNDFDSTSSSSSSHDDAMNDNSNKGKRERKSKTDGKTKRPNTARGRFVGTDEISALIRSLNQSETSDAIDATLDKCKDWSTASMAKLLEHFKMYHTKSATAVDMHMALVKDLKAGRKEPRVFPQHMPNTTCSFGPVNPLAIRMYTEILVFIL